MEIYQWYVSGSGSALVSVHCILEYCLSGWTSSLKFKTNLCKTWKKFLSSTFHLLSVLSGEGVAATFKPCLLSEEKFIRIVSLFFFFSDWWLIERLGGSGAQNRVGLTNVSFLNVICTREDVRWVVNILVIVVKANMATYPSFFRTNNEQAPSLFSNVTKEGACALVVQKTRICLPTSRRPVNPTQKWPPLE